MYGFLITRCIPLQEASLDKPDILSYENVYFYYSPLPKFENDHLFYEDEEKIVLLDGVVFNNHELMKSRKCCSWRETMDQMIQENPRTFQKELRGSFCGALLKKGSAEIMIFTNQSGEKTIYYTQQNTLFIAASHNNILTPILKSQGFPLEPDFQAHKELLCTAEILHGKTPFQGIHRLTAGKYLLEKEESCEELRYHMFRNIPELDLTLEECVEELDKRFRKAVDRIFSKNKEYGYQGECDLSGGLDSRMATWVAHDLGYRNILNVCYCQSGKIDHTTSRKIAHDLGNEYFFLPMDGGDIMMDTDEAVDKFGGQVAYIVCTGANRALKTIAGHNIGLCCTGLLGELHNAYWTEGAVHTPPRYTENRYSLVIPLQVPDAYSTDYDNFEQMNLYEYSALLFLSSALVRQQVCEVTSPFIDVEYLEFAYRIPLKWRKNYHLTMTWMIQKYPQAAQYVWQTKRMPVDTFYHGKNYLPKIADDVCRLPVRLVNKISRILKLPIQFAYSADMNPIQQWYQTNPHLRRFLNGYFQENLDRITDPQLREDVRKTFQEGQAMDKLQAVNLLAVYKRYF